jgi:threonine synthase
VTAAQLRQWRSLSYQQLAFEVMRMYIPPREIPDDDLRRIVDKSYATFRHPDIVPIVPVCGSIPCVQ